MVFSFCCSSLFLRLKKKNESRLKYSPSQKTEWKEGFGCRPFHSKQVGERKEISMKLEEIRPKLERKKKEKRERRQQEPKPKQSQVHPSPNQPGKGRRHLTYEEYKNTILLYAKQITSTSRNKNIENEFLTHEEHKIVTTNITQFCTMWNIIVVPIEQIMSINGTKF